MDLRGQTARVRRTFRYPDDNDETDSQPDAMDEEEQEEYIKRLSDENSARDATFIRILMILPLIVTLPYIRALLNPSTAFLALLSITSLLSTALLLYRLPPTKTGIHIIDDLMSNGSKPASALQIDLSSPLDRFLPYLNAALVVLLALMGVITRSDLPSFGWVGMGNLPAIVYAVVMLAKMVMASVDPESELSGLKYQYKGA